MADFTRAGLRPSDWWREAVRPGAEQIETITELKRLIDRLEAGESLTEDEWVSLIEGRSPELADYLFEKARCIREREYGKAVYVRGLIECSNYCKNDCLYCGIRRSNRNASRYRLSREEILSCCENGYQLGFRTFVLQGGEDPAMTDDWVLEMVQAIRAEFPDCAITLSLGEKKYDTLKRWKEAGADRYLLRHETADACHYARLHPAEMSFEHRMQCLRDLKALGYQTGCGLWSVLRTRRRAVWRRYAFYRRTGSGNGGNRSVYSAARHSVWREGSRNVGRDTVSFRAASPAEAESAASGDDSARNDSSDGTRTGDSGRRKRRDAEPVSGRGARQIYAL